MNNFLSELHTDGVYWGDPGLKRYKRLNEVTKALRKAYLNGLNAGGENTINITYKELVNLRDESKLIPGCYYRITDYQTVSSYTAGHHFDILVMATSKNTLNGNARAIQSERLINGERDTYFDYSRLDLWELVYDINGKYEVDYEVRRDNFLDNHIKEQLIRLGILHRNPATNVPIEIVEIFYPEEAFHLQLNNLSEMVGPIDIQKPAMFCKTIVTVEYNEVYKIYAIDYEIPENITYASELKVIPEEMDGGFDKATRICGSVGNGVILKMRDEFGNECPYDFKNVLFSRKSTDIIDTQDSTDVYCYTFSEPDTDLDVLAMRDTSLHQIPTNVKVLNKDNVMVCAIDNTEIRGVGNTFSNCTITNSILNMNNCKVFANIENSIIVCNDETIREIISNFCGVHSTK